MLKHLHLSQPIGDGDAKLLAASLLNNTTLSRLEVKADEMTWEGKATLLKALFDVSSLNACAESNHTCRIEGLTSQPNESGFSRFFRLGASGDINKHSSSAVNRSMKIFTILTYSRQWLFDMECLSDVPHELMPRILGLAQTFTESSCELTKAHRALTRHGHVIHAEEDDVVYWGDFDGDVPLTCVLELFRGWVVPSLFA